MECPKCGFENRLEARSCKQCGQPLPVAPFAPSPSSPSTPLPIPLEGLKVHIEGGVSGQVAIGNNICLLYTSPSPRDRTRSRMPSSA